MSEPWESDADAWKRGTPLEDPTDRAFREAADAMRRLAESLRQMAEAARTMRADILASRNHRP